MTLPNADDPRGGTPMNTDDELEQAIENIQANFGFGRIANKKIAALIHKSTLHRAIEELGKVDPIASHLLAATVSDRINELQAELHQAEKEGTL